MGFIADVSKEKILETNRGLIFKVGSINSQSNLVPLKHTMGGASFTVIKYFGNDGHLNGGEKMGFFCFILFFVKEFKFVILFKAPGSASLGKIREGGFKKV